VRKLRVEELKPGMFLSKTIRDEKGNALLRKGVKLNSSLIHLLCKRRIPVVWVKDENILQDNATIEIKRKEIEKSLEAKFRYVTQNPIMEELKSILLQYLLKRQIE